ncbi:hypothetical protein ACH5RR_001260 [Cinchona calisaya]|uniref:Uncharacterized protein n=1 Tax=Cinchona calisaya TaxID=153742 RepID=A0ABD3B371_9GENT
MVGQVVKEAMLDAFEVDRIEKVVVGVYEFGKREVWLVQVGELGMCSGLLVLLHSEVARAKKVGLVARFDGDGVANRRLGIGDRGSSEGSVTSVVRDDKVLGDKAIIDDDREDKVESREVSQDFADKGYTNLEHVIPCHI